METDQALIRIKQRELQNVHIERIIQQLEDAFEIALKNHKPPPFSGLIEMQKWFRKVGP